MTSVLASIFGSLGALCLLAAVLNTDSPLSALGVRTVFGIVLLGMSYLTVVKQDKP